MAKDVEITAYIASESICIGSFSSESITSSSFESKSPSPHSCPESDLESNSDLELRLASRKAPKRHADDIDTLDLNKPKCTCIETNSSIRIALQKEGPPTGILRFFHKATEEERQEFLNRSSEENRNHAEELHDRELRHAIRKKNKERRQSRERKRAQRLRMKKLEIAAGLRTTAGKKHQVRVVKMKIMTLQR